MTHTTGSKPSTAGVSRRRFLQRTLSIGAAGLVGGVLAACGKKEGGDPSDPCGDDSEMSAAEKGVRKSSVYKTKSPHAAKKCDNCTHWIAPEAKAPCGGCKVVKGPIAPAGYCNLWVKKA